MVIGADTKGHATLSCTDCSLDIGSLNIKFHGGASWLYNLFSSYIADDLKGSIQSQVGLYVCQLVHFSLSPCMGFIHSIAIWIVILG